jgi:serine/threonine protein kinase/Tfp pilus assembly protein PilF
MFDMIGQTISHYRILEQLGSGGMGVVYKAEDTLLKRPVALKFLPPTLTCDPDAKARFSHEAQAASSLEHANICSIHEIAEHDGQTFIVMGYYEGETLKMKIESAAADGGLKIEDALDFAIQVAQGLSRAHEAGIIHRDIKPANIFITTHNEVKILDFGLAKLTGQTILTKSGSTLGTAAYMSPEQARGEQVDHRTDIWSLGVVMYEMLTGYPPFQSDYEQALIYSILNEPSPPMCNERPEVPEVVEQIVARAMAKRPEERYQQASELLADLKIARGKEVTGGVVLATVAAEQTKRKRLFKRLAVALAAFVLILAALFLLWPSLHDELLASNPRTIAVISFENQTGDKSQDHIRNVLQEAIITSMEQSKYLRVTTRQRMADILKQMGKKDVEFVDNELGLEICHREGTRLMAVGTFAKVGELYQTTLKLIDVNTLETMGSYSAKGTGLESLLEKQIDELSREVSKGIGVSEKKTQEQIRPVAEISTTSMEAYQLYLRGQQENARLAWTEGRRFFEMAVQKDSAFAMSWYELAGDCYWLRDYKAGDDAHQKAASLASRATQKDQYVIAAQDSSLRATLLGLPGLTDLEFLKLCTEKFPQEKRFFIMAGTQLMIHEFKARESIPWFKKALELDPGYPPTLSQLGNAYLHVRDWANATEMFKRYAAASPGDPNPYDDMGNMYSGRQMYDEAVACYKQALAVSPTWTISVGALRGIFFNREQYDSAFQWLDTSVARDKDFGNQAECLQSRASMKFWLGSLNEAEKLLLKREALLTKAGQRVDHTADFLKIWIACERRQFAQSRHALSLWGTQSVEEESPGYRRVEAMLVQLCGGFIDIRAGDMDSAAIRVARIDSIGATVASTDTSQEAKTIRSFSKAYHALLQSECLLSAGRAEQALTVRPKSGPRDLASRPCVLFNPGFRHGIDGPIPVMVDVVPRAYVALDQLDSAIASYEKAVSHEVSPGRPIFPRYHYRLAVQYEQKGVKEKAIEQYEMFLKIWGKADPVYKEPADARARLARLKSTM